MQIPSLAYGKKYIIVTMSSETFIVRMLMCGLKDTLFHLSA